jgi:hypothetical protein
MSDTYTAGFVGPLSLDYGATGRSASLTIKVVNVGAGTTYYAASGTGITEPETGLYTKASFTYPTSINTYRSAWYDTGVFIDGSADEFRVTAASSDVTLAATASGSLTSTLSFLMKRGDTDPTISAQALVPDPSDPSGATFIPWPIPGGATVMFTMRDVQDFSGRTRTGFSAGPAKVHAAATVDDYTLGLLSYGWIAADTDTDGAYRGEFEVTSGGEIRTFPSAITDARNWIAITITDDLDPGVNP